MILCVDIGNTNTTCALFEGRKIRARFRLQSEIGLTPDELGARLAAILKLYDLSFEDLGEILLASVVPPLTSVWVEMSRKYLRISPRIPRPENLGITVKLRTPSEVGIDRVLNALAGWEKYRSNLIVVDYGTATTFDCISEKGEYLGGAIAPGILLAAESLFQKTSMLPRVELFTLPPEIIGKDTFSALKSGLLYGFAALTDGLIAKMALEFEKKPRVIATGGLAPLMQRLSYQIERVEPDLTLEGLLYWFEKSP
ncbi:MAG: type III pantothenate kinase [Thermodesulfobacteria bacterium]|nr:type III pantothenate kinase [Thermodesulfobacteriota bacterium]